MHLARASTLALNSLLEGLQVTHKKENKGKHIPGTSNRTYTSRTNPLPQFSSLSHIILRCIELLLRHTDPQQAPPVMCFIPFTKPAVPCHSLIPSNKPSALYPMTTLFLPSLDKQHTKGDTPKLLSIPYMLIVAVFRLPIYLQLFLLQIHHSVAMR
jgi:hypothetical protein